MHCSLKKSLFLALVVSCQLWPGLTLKPRIQPPLALEHVTIIDVTGGPVKPDMTVLIEADRIVSIGRSGTIPVPASATTVNASGKFLVPGLWDMHVHALQDERVRDFFTEFVANGVTGIRDMGSPLEELDHFDRWRSELAAGTLLGPRFIAAGPILDGPDPVFPEISIAVSSDAKARRTVDMLKARGVDFL
ncbi:MAG TPA: hypothetical protein VEZ90_14435, partial [Blastocatellia bacterium]|nr:hypothetical protein [Blastocatellia bacterium]